MSVGVDIVSVQRVERLLHRFRDRFLGHYFTPAEVADARGRTEGVAVRWAAKEAVVKALARDGFQVHPRQVEVLSGGGPPTARVVGMDLSRLTLSLSHDGDLAVAVAIAGVPASAPAPAAVKRAGLSTEDGSGAGLASHPGLKFPDRAAGAHKGDFGTVAVLAGSLGYTGAAYLCAMGAARGGAGIVRLMVAESIYPILAAKCAEVIVIPLGEVAPGVVGHFSLDDVMRQLRGARAGVIGPGMGRDLSNRRLVVDVLQGSTIPLVVDADGLNALADNRRSLSRLRENHVFTPHPGEMSRLTGIPVEQIQARREQVAAEHARQWGQVVVLKGAQTVIASPSGRVTVDPHRNPALATAGTGDVLAGLIGALIAQGLEPEQAAITGVHVHAEAAEQWSSEFGDSGMLASDLLLAIPRVVHLLKTGS